MPNEMSKGELTRREIVKKAAPLFNRKGYEGTSLSDLMQATGLQKGGIYRHFSSKQQLAGEAFDYSWEKAVSGRLEGVNEVPNSVHRLRKMIDNFVEKREGLVPGGCPLINTAVESDDRNTTSPTTSIPPSAPALWVPYPAVFRVRFFLCLFASLPLYFLTESQNPLQSAQSAASTSSPASDAPDALRTRPAPPCPQISSRPPAHIRRREEKYSSPPRSPATRGSAPASREFPPPLAASAPPSRPASIETQTYACT